MREYQSIETEIFELILHRLAAIIFLKAILKGASIESRIRIPCEKVKWENIDNLSNPCSIKNHNYYKDLFENEPWQIERFRSA